MKNYPGLLDILWVLLPGFAPMASSMGIGIHSFRPIQTCLIVKVLATSVTILKQTSYCTVINCTFPFYITNIFGCFNDVMAQLWTSKAEVPKVDYIATFICTAFKSHNEWSLCTYQLTNTMIQPATIVFFPWLEMPSFTRYICHWHVSKYYKSFDSKRKKPIFIRYNVKHIFCQQKIGFYKVYRWSLVLLCGQWSVLYVNGE